MGINGDKEVEKVARVVATKGDIVPPGRGRGRKGPGRRGHFDASWLKAGRGGAGKRETGGGDDTKTSPSWDTSQDVPFL